MVASHTPPRAKQATQALRYRGASDWYDQFQVVLGVHFRALLSTHSSEYLVSIRPAQIRTTNCATSSERISSSTGLATWPYFENLLYTAYAIARFWGVAELSESQVTFRGCQVLKDQALVGYIVGG